MSPRRKRRKLPRKADETKASTSEKRANEDDGASSKKLKPTTTKEPSPEEDIQAKKRKNFVTACEQVSYKAYFDHRARLQIMYLPTCMKRSVCKHHDSQTPNIRVMTSEAEEAFVTDIKTNSWCEALDVCRICITPDQYLSAKVLKEIVEIMLNAQEDEYAGHSVSNLIDKCHLVLMQNFSTHPPCLAKTLKKCYNDFLTSPLDAKEKTFTNRTNYASTKGIVKYCMNRLEYEISAESKDESLINKDEKIPEEMKQTIKGLHWQKEKFEIYECHERTERIDRLMAVLSSIIELLQFDLAIWNSRYTSNMGNHIMRSHRPLMAFVLWTDNILYTGVVNSNCKQILRLFVCMVHLKYPEKYIDTMATWLNAVVQTFYICETNSNADYPNTGKYCAAFADAFYKIIAVLPQESIIRIIEKIQPAIMKHLIGTLHLKNLLSTQETCILRNLIDFIKQSQWNDFPITEDEIQVSRNTLYKVRKTKRRMKHLAKICNSWTSHETVEEIENKHYPKMGSELNKKKMDLDEEINCNEVVHTMFLTLEAYLDAYSVLNVQKTLYDLNQQLLQNDKNHACQNFLPELTTYSVSEQFIKKYKYIYQMLKELVPLLQATNSKEDSPKLLKVFEKIDLLT